MQYLWTVNVKQKDSDKSCVFMIAQKRRENGGGGMNKWKETYLLNVLCIQSLPELYLAVLTVYTLSGLSGINSSKIKASRPTVHSSGYVVICTDWCCQSVGIL